MTLKEFEERTGKPISAETYDAIEKTAVPPEFRISAALMSL